MTDESYRTRIRFERNSVNKLVIEYLEGMSRLQRNAWLKDAVMLKLQMEHNLLSTLNSDPAGVTETVSKSPGVISTPSAVSSNFHETNVSEEPNHPEEDSERTELDADERLQLQGVFSGAAAASA